MIDALFRALCIGGGVAIGSKLGRKYLGPEGEKPLWNGHLGNNPRLPAVQIGQVFHHGQTWYRLYIAAEGDWALVGQGWQYAEILALIQSWEAFVVNGGTLNAWRLQNELRAREMADMEAAMHSAAEPDRPKRKPRPGDIFVRHPDGTVESVS